MRTARSRKGAGFCFWTRIALSTLRPRQLDAKGSHRTLPIGRSLESAALQYRRLAPPPGALFVTSKKANGQAKPAQRVIKKYPNRRLYDTDTSTYITLAEVKQLVMQHQSFVVR